MESNGIDTRRAVGAASEREGVSWGGAWTGFVVAAAFLFLWTSLWAAIGYGSHVSAFTGNALGWWVAATVVVSVWLGGFVAVWTGRVERAPAAVLTGLTVWGLFTLGTLIFGQALGRAAGIVAAGAAASGTTGVGAGSLQGLVGGGAYLIFGTTVLSAFAAAVAGMQAAKLLLARRHETADRSPQAMPPRAVDVREGSAAPAR